MAILFIYSADRKYYKKKKFICSIFWTFSTVISILLSIYCSGKAKNFGIIEIVIELLLIRYTVIPSRGNSYVKVVENTLVIDPIPAFAVIDPTTH